MSGIISYAQNFEDVMLWRALGHIENGFYIDIGAQDPTIDSVSLAFHEHGWHGIHVEPTPHYAELLRRQRSGDLVIQAAVGNGPAVLRFFEIPDTGISTADPIIAQQHRERGFDVHEIIVTCIALSAVFETCIESEIHWLKIDVEGFEQQVLTSWDKSAARPWIVVVESTLPLTQIETHETWKSILITYGYTSVYFDGLNRYYISDVHPELKDAFLTPPNVFDSFSLNGTASATFHHLIDVRHKQKIIEIAAQSEQRNLATEREIERLTLNLAALNKTCAEYEQNRAQHEQAWATQLLAVRQQADAEKNESNRQHQAQLQELQRQQAEHKRLSAERVDTLNRELHRILTDHTAREQIHSDRYTTLQQEFTTLLRLQAQREHEVTQQLQATYQELRRMEQQRSQHEQALDKEIATLQKEILTRHHDQQLQAQQHNTELSARLDERSHLIEAYTTLEKTLKDEILLEQQTSLHLRKTLAEIQQNLASTHASLTWRMTAPLRKLATLFTADPASPLNVESESRHTIIPPVFISEIQHAYIEPTMPPTAQNTCSPDTVSTLEELLSYYDQQFVQCAYKTLLGREPDPQGMHYYLRRLRSGFSKIQILAQLSLSAEAEEYDSNLPGLNSAIKHHRKGRYPLIGWIFRLLNGSEGNQPTERKLRIIENQLFLFSDESNNRFNQMETALAGLHDLITQQAQHASAQPGSATQSSFDAAASISPIQPEDPDGLKQLSPRARDIYSRLKKTSAKLFGRAA